MKLKYTYSFTDRYRRSSGQMSFNNFDDAIKAAISVDSFSTNRVNRNISNENGTIICSISDFVIFDLAKSLR